MKRASLAVAVSIALLSVAMPAAAAESKGKGKSDAETPPDMTFFLSSTGSGKGADFGGLAGADKHCENLAGAAGASKHTWRAYLSTTGAGGVKRARPHWQRSLAQRRRAAWRTLVSRSCTASTTSTA